MSDELNVNLGNIINGLLVSAKTTSVNDMPNSPVPAEPTKPYNSYSNLPKAVVDTILAGTNQRDAIETGTVRKGPAKYGGSLDDVTANIATEQAHPTPGVSDILLNAYTTAVRSSISNLGFDPTKVGLDTSGTELNYAGAYNGKTDTTFSSSKYTGNIVHEATHRGLELLTRSGMLTPEETEFVSRHNEDIVRYTMATKMGDLEGSQGAASKEERDSAMDYFASKKYPGFSADKRKLLSSISYKASLLTARDSISPTERGDE